MRDACRRRNLRGRRLSSPREVGRVNVGVNKARLSMKRAHGGDGVRVD